MFRLKQNTLIEKVVRKKDSVGNRYFVIYKGNDSENHKIAISVSKKYGNAVYRNHAKRHIREILKKHEFVNKEILFVIKPTSKDLTFKEKEKQIDHLLKKHDLLRR